MTRLLVLLLALVGLVAACQSPPPSSRGKQLDFNLLTLVGVGNSTTSTTLPHGRFTLFSYADPPECVRSVAVLDGQSRELLSDRSFRTPRPPGTRVQQMVPTMVQRELSAGSYQLAVRTINASCAWMVQTVLNSMVSNDPPPVAQRPSPAPAINKTIGDLSQDRSFRITTPGIYHVRLQAVTCPFSADLQAADGHTEHLAENAQSANGTMGTDNPIFLGAGEWTAMVNSACGWRLTISPWIGELGGGAQGFGAPQ